MHWLGDRVRDTFAQRRIDRAWIAEQSAGPDRGELTIARRFFANATDAERDLIAYSQMVKLVEDAYVRYTRGAMLDGRQAQSTRIEGSRGAGLLADRALHLQLDQPVHLDRVLHWELLDDRLDESVDDQL